MNNIQSLNFLESHKTSYLWNKWAKSILAEREQLEKAGKWKVEIDPIGQSLAGNEETQDWLDRAEISFELAEFDTVQRFDHFIFPGTTRFGKVTFEESASFHFTQFLGFVEFNHAVFKEASFFRSEFHQRVQFSHSRFEGMAYFGNTTFLGPALFLDTTFSRSANFNKVSFQGEVKFRSIHVDGTFWLNSAKFAELPDFRQAHFSESPDLDCISHIPQIQHKDKETAAKYRALKRMAKQEHNHKLELDFFAGELQADSSFLAKLYDMFSDYGRSLSAPLFYWLITFLYASMGYHMLSLPSIDKGGVHSPPTCSIMASAIELSFRKSLLALGWEKSTRLDQLYACLYGGGAHSPALPFAASFIGFLQTLLSAIFIFLALLALRNRFRIK